MSTLKTINLQHPTAATANITLSNTGGIALNGSVSGGGMDLITPTSVVGGTLSGGSVTYTAASLASPVNLNGVFSATYDRYLITNSGTVSTGIQFLARLRAAGTDAITNYNYYRLLGNAGGVVGSNTSSATSVAIGGGAAGAQLPFRLTVVSPASAVSTSFINDGMDATNLRLDLYIGAHTTATAYDGITFFPSSGTITGTLRVYGLKNS
jgi:hypothetical protein